MSSSRDDGPAFALKRPLGPPRRGTAAHAIHSAIWRTPLQESISGDDVSLARKIGRVPACFGTRSGKARRVTRLVDRYVFKTTLTAFLAALGILTFMIWITSALRDFDLLTTKGQSLLSFSE